MADPRSNVLVHPQQIALSVILATSVFLVEVSIVLRNLSTTSTADSLRSTGPAISFRPSSARIDVSHPRFHADGAGLLARRTPLSYSNALHANDAQHGSEPSADGVSAVSTVFRLP